MVARPEPPTENGQNAQNAQKPGTPIPLEHQPDSRTGFDLRG